MTTVEKELKKYRKILNDFEVQEKITEVYLSIAKLIDLQLMDENNEDITDIILKDEIAMERIDTEVISFMFYKELEKWFNR